MSNNSDNTNMVVLVTAEGEDIGICEKLKAHEDGALHRAFSLMIARRVDNSVEYLLQKRALDKYHSGGLWANSCCSHPQPHEPVYDAVQRRVGEELGIAQQLNLTSLEPIIYKAHLDSGLTEFEYDHLFLSYDFIHPFRVNSNEVSEVKWVNEKDIDLELQSDPEKFAAWFPYVFAKIKEYQQSQSVKTQ